MSDTHPRRSPHRPDQDPQAAAARGAVLVRRSRCSSSSRLVAYVCSDNKPAGSTRGRKPRARWRHARRTSSAASPSASARSAPWRSAMPTGRSPAARKSSRPSARPATRPAWRARPSSATPPPGPTASSNGFDALVQSALKGKGAMPPQGRWRFRRHRDRPCRGLHGQRRRRQVRRARSACRRRRCRRPPQRPAAAAPAAAPAAAAAARCTAARRCRAPAPPQAAAAGAGEALYKQTCMACHATGVAGAPKLGDKAAWAPRVQQGLPALVQTAIKGKGAMPPKGGTTASGCGLHAAVEYMVSAAK